MIQTINDQINTLPELASGDAYVSHRLVELMRLMNINQLVRLHREAERILNGE